MRLINVQSFQLEWFHDAQSAPSYAILSHTWEADEVVYADFLAGEWEQKTTAQKIRSSAAQARKDGLAYVWVDSCCIDKSSSAELSEAINSMFKWYAYARVCYAYLADAVGAHGSSIQDCRWFTRGFTLQELIAPSEVQFFNESWCCIGSRTELRDRLSRITNIDSTLLSRRSASQSDPALALNNVNSLLRRFNIATRMSWAAKRSTTRVEDLAYCLLGVFNINMPLLYGEGMKAFHRLQEEIMNRFDDPSILAFQGSSSLGREEPTLLAQHPREFLSPLPSVQHGLSQLPMLRLGKSRVTVNLLICPVKAHQIKTPATSGPIVEDLIYAMFDCNFARDWLARPAILLKRVGGGAKDDDDDMMYVRQDPHLYSVSRGQSSQAFVRLEYPVVGEESSNNKSLTIPGLDGDPKTRESGVIIWCESAKRQTLTILDQQSLYLTQETQLLNEEVPHVEIFIQNGSGLLGQSNYSTGRSAHTVHEEKEGIADSYSNTGLKCQCGCTPRGIVEFVEERQKEDRFFVTWGFLVISPAFQSTTTTSFLKPWCRLWTLDSLRSALKCCEGDNGETDIEFDFDHHLFDQWQEARTRLMQHYHEDGKKQHKLLDGNADKLATKDQKSTLVATMTVHSFLDRPFFEMRVVVEPKTNNNNSSMSCSSPVVVQPKYPVYPTRDLSPNIPRRALEARKMEEEALRNEENWVYVPPASSGRKRTLLFNLMSGNSSRGNNFSFSGGGGGGESSSGDGSGC